MTSTTSPDLTAARYAVEEIDKLSDEDLSGLYSRLYQTTFSGIGRSIEPAMMSLLLMVGSVASRRQGAYEQEVADAGDGHFVGLLQNGPEAPALAYCSPCSWCGPLRDTAAEAEGDGAQHRSGETVEDEEWI